ncbi:MAG: hypothetical protein NZ703_02235 [Gemmataceae bacterium]|nr:hypothetical protein [Gemmataceae bacterium]
MIPMPIVYVGLGALLLALVVASALQGGSLRVFFLLALRLAIGWHFLFEGLHKIHSHYVGPTETSRPFSSAVYFRTAPGPLGDLMRRQFEDPETTIAQRVQVSGSVDAAVFRRLSAEEQAQACPPAVAQELEALLPQIEEAVRQEAERELSTADKEEAAGLARAKTEADKETVRRAAEQARTAARHKLDNYGTIARQRLTAAQAAYARWVLGVDTRPTRLKFFSGDDVSLTAPQRLALLDQLRQQLHEAQERLRLGLGNGYGIEQKRAAELRTDYLNALSDLARDADAFLTDLKKELVGDLPLPAPPPSRGELLDRITMWFLVLVGTLLLIGLFTPLACLAAVGFLVLTYLAHPPFPWFPLPPGTEGNPIFINKNVIEALALCVILVHPTGRWLGLDALWTWWCCRRRCPAPAPSTPSSSAAA